MRRADDNQQTNSPVAKVQIHLVRCETLAVAEWFLGLSCPGGALAVPEGEVTLALDEPLLSAVTPRAAHPVQQAVPTTLCVRTNVHPHRSTQHRQQHHHQQHPDTHQTPHVCDKAKEPEVDGGRT